MTAHIRSLVFLLFVCAVVGGCGKRQGPENGPAVEGKRQRPENSAPVEAKPADLAAQFPTGDDLKKVAAGLRKGMTPAEYRKLLKTVKPDGVWIADHGDAGAVLRHQAENVRLVLIFNGSAAAADAKLVSWEVTEAQDSRQ